MPTLPSLTSVRPGAQVDKVLARLGPWQRLHAPPEVRLAVADHGADPGPDLPKVARAQRGHHRAPQLALDRLRGLERLDRVLERLCHLLRGFWQRRAQF